MKKRNFKGHDHSSRLDKFDRRAKWETRFRNLSEVGKVHYIWECEWKSQIKQHYTIQTEVGRILYSTDTENELLRGILNGTLFGFATVSVKCPQWLYDQYQRDGFLFPPIFKKLSVTEDMLSPFMREKYEQEDSKCDEPTLVQVYNGTDLLLYTPLIQFYAQKGFIIYDVKQFTQYVPGKVFAPFVKKGEHDALIFSLSRMSYLVYDMRVSATREGDEAKATTAKLFGNSSYGKTCEGKIS